MVETGSFQAYDLLAVVWCRPEQQLARAVARGMEEDRARQLLAAQMPLAEKCKRAAIVIDNSGTTDDLAQEIRRAWSEITRRCR